MTHVNRAPVLLVANRGEIAVRIMRTARDLGMTTVAVHPADDADSLHVSLADRAVELPGLGAGAYLDIAGLAAVIGRVGADYVHPGYGFLSESAEFARAVAAAGAVFVGPRPAAIEAVGDKDRAKTLAAGLGINTIPATGVLAGPEQARAFQREAGGPIALKAVAGGGGRGIVPIGPADDGDALFARAAAEAAAGFGDERLLAERWLTGTRHIEVQALGTAEGIRILGDRDCSLQRRRQKFLEIAPAAVPTDIRTAIHAAAGALLEAIDYTQLATVEFLVTDDDWFFLEVNPRIQVEHTVTEEVLGIDLVAAQLRLAQGLEMSALPDGQPTGRTSVQARITAERMSADGTVHPATGTLASADFPLDRHVRVDTWVRSGTRIGASYDTLLAKLIVTADDLETAVARLDRALLETRITGVETNIGLQRAVIAAGLPGHADTGTFDGRSAELLASIPETGTGPDAAPAKATEAPAVELAVDETPVPAPLSGTVVSLEARPGELGLIEAMKMHHAIPAPPHTAARALVAIGDTVTEGQPVFAIVAGNTDRTGAASTELGDHPAVAEAVARHAGTTDEAHPADVEKIHRRGRRTARENLAELVVPGTFVEYGGLAIAAQRARRSHADLIDRTRGDGLVGGIGTVRTDRGDVRAVVMSYDYTVLAGTQGARNHAKTDRLLHVAGDTGLPIVFFCEGGGGRPGDTDIPPGPQLNVGTFAALAGLRGRVPLIAIASGRCFAGNAALAGVCDVIIATEDLNLGMGGPAMISGGGLGDYRPEDVGPVRVHRDSGAVDLVVPGDAEAVAATRDYLAMFAAGGAGEGAAAGGQEDATGGTEPAAPDRAAILRAAVPADRLRAFDMRSLLRHVFDDTGFTELRSGARGGAICGFARIDGAPVGFVANNNRHLGGAIDVDTARNLTQHLRLVESYGLPLVAFIDTPGFMVGPEAEREPGVRAFGDLFCAGAALTVPTGSVVIRKAYGLGAMAMSFGSLHETRFTVAWPSGELGPMGLEGAVRLGFSKELAAVPEGEERDALFTRLLDRLYEQGRAMSAAETFDIDDVIDPADTRAWLGLLHDERGSRIRS